MTYPNKSQQGPLVTVLISTYNRPQYLRQALASVFAQTWSNFEVIVVRDGGLPVREAIAEFLDDPRLRLIDRDVNRGKPYSFNEALTQARGEYVCYLDDDDMFFLSHIETLITAMLSQDRCQAVYSDLYKAHCRVLPDGRRVVLAKNVEISRDYDPMLMLQFNQTLHVSLMHRRDLLDRAGPYNENLNVLIDWDLTRRLCFYTDFLHVPTVTGQYYAPVGQCDRISVQRRKDVNDYMRNLLTIRSTRPPKPWPCMHDLSVIVILADGASPERTISDLWSHTFYPNQYYVPLTPHEQERFSTPVPNVIPVPVPASHVSAQQRVDAALKVCDGDHIAIITCGISIPADEAAYLERSLYPVLQNPQQNVAYEIVEATPDHWGVIVRKDALIAARQSHPDVSIRHSLQAANINIKKPQFAEYPFQFDNYLIAAFQKERQGDWSQAARIYEIAAEQYGNTLWMQTRQANALYQQSQWEQAAALAGQLNQTAPTVARLMIEARARRKLNDYSAAVALYRRAEAILDRTNTKYPHGRVDAAAEASEPVAQPVSGQQESHVWMS